MLTDEDRLNHLGTRMLGLRLGRVGSTSMARSASVSVFLESRELKEIVGGVLESLCETISRCCPERLCEQS